ncbi:MAG: dodecin domain-containing protein [Syntrophobacterales bacterium]|nr:dodecin domain-containing protein [Syntrophobacterales bacterium]
MSNGVYKFIELVGTSKVSWEDAAKNAVELAGKSLDELRIAEVGKLDMRVENGKVVAYRARVNVSFKYEQKEAWDDLPKATNNDS